MDPFESPATDAALPQGTLDVGRAVSEAVGAALANALSAIGVVLLGYLSLVVAFCTCIGWIPAIPLLYWGAYRWLLDAMGGSARVSALWSGAERFGEVFLRMWGLMLIWLVLSIPLAIAMGALTFPAAFEAALTGQQPDPVSQALIQGGLTAAFGLLVVRLMLAPFYMVERDLGVVDALSASWRDTTGQWGKLIVLQLLITLLGLPAQVLAVGVQVYQQTLDTEQEMLEAAPIVFGLFSVTALLSIAVLILGQLFFASAYRQLTGPPPEGEVASA